MLLLKGTGKEPITVPCIQKCISMDDCLSFVIHFDQNVCYWFRIPIQGVKAIDNEINPFVAWFRKVCLITGKIYNTNVNLSLFQHLFVHFWTYVSFFFLPPYILFCATFFCLFLLASICLLVGLPTLLWYILDFQFKMCFVYFFPLVLLFVLPESTLSLLSYFDASSNLFVSNFVS